MSARKINGVDFITGPVPSSLSARQSRTNFIISLLILLGGPPAYSSHQEMVPDKLKRKNTMSNKLASLTQNEKNIYTGTLVTMAVRTKIHIAPNTMATGDQPDYRIFANNSYEIGVAWKKTSSRTGNPYLSVRLAAPELGAMAIYANLVAVDEIGDDGITHIMLWSAKEAQPQTSNLAA